MSWRDQLFHNPRLKLLSVGLSCLVWYAVHGHHQAIINPPENGPTVVKEYFRIPITIMQTAPEGRIYRVDPADVTVRVTGDQSLLQELRGSDLEVFVNLTDMGDKPAANRRVKVMAPAGVKVLRVEPVMVHIERQDLNRPSLLP